MRIKFVLLILGISFFISHAKDLNVTVYNDDLGVIREVRSFDLKKGINEIFITDVAERIDATSVGIKFDGKVIEQNFRYDLVSLSKILHKYIDKKISLKSKTGEIVEGTLLSAGGNIVLQTDNSGLLMIPNPNEYTITVDELPENFLTRPTLVWKLFANKAGKQDIEFNYMTSNIDWHAEYVATLNENDSEMDIIAWVSIDNKTGTSYNDANLKLIAGDVNRVQDYGGHYEKIEIRNMSMASDAAMPEFEEEAFFEYHMYSLDQKADLLNNETKQMALFDAKEVSVEKEYHFNIGRYGIEKQNAKVNIAFKNEMENKLGLPFPKGKVRLFKNNGETTEFIGEDRVNHTPKNEEIKLFVGEAFDVLLDSKVTDKKRISDKIYEFEQEIVLTNRKDEDIVINVEVHLGSNWDILSSSEEYEKKDAYKIEYQIAVKADSKKKIDLKTRISN